MRSESLKGGFAEVSDNVIIKTENLCKHYGGIKALDGVSIDIKKGEVVVMQVDNPKVKVRGGMV